MQYTVSQTVIDVFSDASQNGTGGICGGAYVIGHGGSPVQVKLSCRNNMVAELLTLLTGLHAAVAVRDEIFESTGVLHKILIHTDLLHIENILKKGKFKVTREINSVLMLAGATIVPDAWDYDEYKACHYHAKIQSRCFGVDHPGIIK